MSAGSRRDQLALALGPFQNRKLFADHFLRERLPEWPEFRDADPKPALAALTELWAREGPALPGANEAQTEARFIRPVLEHLGFAYTVQSGVAVASRRRAPDYALFLSEADRALETGAEGAARFRRAVAVAEAKSFDRPLDVRRAGPALSEDPVAQIIHYVSITRCRWGILTNGRLWRLYGAEGDLVEGASYEVDLVHLIETGDPEAFRYFLAFFGSPAFAPDAGGRSFLDRVLGESTANAVRVGQALQEQVYAAVPRIAQGLIGEDERSRASLDRAFDHALVLLYRMLFCLHAEARGLLPVENPHYRDYSLLRIKQGVAADRDGGRVFSERVDDLYNGLRALFRIVDGGEDALGVAEYNGGLFRASRYPYFEGRVVTDHLLAPALDALARVGSEFVDYRDLSVRHLGTIYEGLLAHRLEPLDPGPGLRLARSEARHDAGAYFTPEPVVDRIVERTLDPLLEERSRRARQEALTGQDALELFLGLRVLDPAMGSGHFLVSAAAWIAQYIATDPSYDGDLPLVELRRRVAERCLYGVDLEPMAVELAQLALWLTTVNRDQPLAFLHNLRVGNALVGADLRASLEGREGTVFGDRLGEAARALLERTNAIHSRPSQTGTDVHEKERAADAVALLREPLGRLADDALPETLIEEAGPALHWELEFPEVFLGPDGRPDPAGGFDAVIGNPPYVRIQRLGRALAEHCRRRFATASGSFDVYIPFVEQGLALLAPQGRLGFIMPNKFTKLDYGARLRGWLARDGLLEEIVDFGDSQLFPGVTNYTAIVVLAREGGREEIAYRRVRGDAGAVSRALVNLDAVAAERYPRRTLDANPWVLAVGEEAALLRHLAAGAERLGDATHQIFQGLITSADPVYIVEDRGGGDLRRVVSRASGRELLLEPDLLHPLASGADVDHYALLPLRHLLIFPYRRGGDGEMRLLTPAELEELPLSRAYLGEHEAALRARERGRMDHDGWFGYVYPKSLGAHELPKLGVAATVRRLEVAADPSGAAYFHNVRVNGILPATGGPSLWALLVLLNSRPLDWVFRRGASEHANGFFAANKQFIAPLPVRIPGSDEAAALDDLGQRLHATAAAIAAERQAFLDWLGDAAGARVRDLAGWTTLAAYEQRDLPELLAVLRRNAARLSEDVAGRAFRELLDRERSASLARLAPLRADLRRDEAAAEDAVAHLYRLSASQRALIAAG